jgi:hypothetical protein
MSRSWENAYAIGIKGEAIAPAILQRFYPGAQVIAVKDTKDQKWLHSDFVVYYKNDRFLVETKYDTHSTGNIAVESHIHYLSSNRIVPGWLHKSKADRVLYILSAFKRAYLIDLAWLRLEISKGNFRLAKTNVQGKYEPYFYLVSMQALNAHRVNSMSVEEEIHDTE